MQFSRKQMEEEADRLGVPWTHATTDEQLHALVQSRLRGDQMTEETVTHECHGLFWDFPKEDACKECSGQQSCFQKFCSTTFPAMQAKLGPGATLVQLAKALDVSQESVLVAMNQQSKAAPAPAPVELEPEEVEEEEAVEEEEEAEDESEEEEFEDADELEDELEAEPEEVEEDEEPPAEPEPEPEPPSETEMAAKKKTKKKTPAQKKAASKKAPAKKAASKKAPAKKKAASKKTPAKTPPPVSSEATEVQDPTQAESAQTATGSAKSKARAKSASRAKGQAGPSKTGGAKKGSGSRKAKPLSTSTKKKKASRVAHVEDPWGEHTFLPRYERERKRSKAVGKLRPGMKLKREYQGEVHQVTVLKQFYRYKGDVFPTLYSIVKEITGTKEAPRQLDKDGKRPKGTRQLCNWSAPKFFNLKG